LSLAQLTGVASFDLCYNYLTGTIATEFGRLTKLNEFSLCNNR